MIGLLGFLAIWVSGRFWPQLPRLAMAFGWWALIAVVHSPVLPQPNLGSNFVGGELRLWLVFALLVVLAVAYRSGLQRLRAKAVAKAPPTPEPESGPFREVEVDRYARHLMLREIGGMGQQRLKKARVLVVGAGGLGSPSLLYLAAAGVGHITVIDPDRVDGSNLQRQIIHADRDIGELKAESAAEKMRALNPFITVDALPVALGEDALALIARHDLVLDGTDQFATRVLINRLAVEAGVPLLSGAIGQWEGQISLFDPKRGAPCLACVFPEAPSRALAPNCAEAGVAGPLPGVIGSYMALEAVKEICQAGEGLAGRMLILDGLYGEHRTIKVSRRVDCAVCGGAGHS